MASHYGLSLFHWNIQYVLGSTETEDALVKQSFEPIVDLYLAHPGWKVTFEMQGYMIEVLAERHPRVLEKLQALAANHQLELISCHYSDQFVLAYPRADLEKSLTLNDSVFAAHGLSLSPVIFLQEAQTGEGIMKVLGEHGRTIAAVTGGWDEFRRNPESSYYEQGGTTVVMAGHGAPWLFLGDAELAAVNKGTNPYTFYVGQYIGLSWWYKKSAKTLQKLSDRISSFEQGGGKTAFIADYVSDLEKAGIPKLPTGPILDKMRGNFTNNVWLWMGDNRDQFAEDDERVVSGNYRARNYLLAAETAVAWAKARGLPLRSDADSRLAAAWRTQLLGEGSDSTGLGFPLSIEVNFSIRAAETVVHAAQEILGEVKKANGTEKISVDTKTGNVTAAVLNLDVGTVVPEGPLPLIKEGGMSYSKATWRKFNENKYEVEVAWTPALPASLSYTLDHVKIGFPSTDANVTYSPALLEAEIRSYPLTDFAFEGIYLPLSNGLIGLGDGWYVIKHAIQNHVAARVDRPGHRITFETRNPTMRMHRWRFTLLRGTPEDALRAADEINVHPKIEF
jgi:hypothetical protein